MNICVNVYDIQLAVSIQNDKNERTSTFLYACPSICIYVRHCIFMHSATAYHPKSLGRGDDNVYVPTCACIYAPPCSNLHGTSNKIEGQ